MLRDGGLKKKKKKQVHLQVRIRISSVRDVAPGVRSLCLCPVPSACIMHAHIRLPVEGVDCSICREILKSSKYRRKGDVECTLIIHSVCRALSMFRGFCLYWMTQVDSQSTHGYSVLFVPTKDQKNQSTSVIFSPYLTGSYSS